MRRREFIFGVGLATVFTPQRAGSIEGKRPLIGVLVGGSEASSKRYRGSFDKGLEELGYLAGRDIEVVYRYADGDTARFSSLAEEVFKLGCSIIVSGTTLGASAAKKAAAGTPIVSPVLRAPVGFGVATSQSRTRGSRTGNIKWVGNPPGTQTQIVCWMPPGWQRR